MSIRLTSLLVMLLMAAFTSVSQVKWLETEHNFGTIDEDMGKVTCKMRLVNVGEYDVVIDDVRVTCGCTASDYSRRPIAPGDTAYVSVTYNPLGRPGKFSKDVKVFTNTEPRRSTLNVSGFVIGTENTVRKRYPEAVGNLNFEKLIAPFGKVKKTQTRTHTLKAYNRSRDTMVITFENVPRYIKAIATPERVAPADMAAITLYYNGFSQPDWGFVSDSLTIVAKEMSTEIENRATIEVSATLEEDFSKLSQKEIDNTPRIALSTEKLDLGIVSADTDRPIKVKLEIENYGKNPLKIRKIYSLDKGITVNKSTGEVKNGKNLQVTVSVDSSLVAENNMINAKLFIITNDPTHAQAIVRVVGEIK